MAWPVTKYDQVASSFDQRYKVCSYPGVRTAFRDLVRCRSISQALEIGCGTGHWLRELELLGISCTGVDISCQMLRRAQRNVPRSRLICGSAGHLPFRNAVFDLAYCINAFHHFSGPQRFLAEAARVLRPDGLLAIIGLDPHRTDTCWYLYDYFAEVRQWDLERYRPVGQIATWLKEAEFKDVTSRVVETFSQTWEGDEVWNDAFLRKESTSQLIALSDQAYAAGLERIKQVIAGADSAHPATFPVLLNLVMTTGVRR